MSQAESNPRRGRRGALLPSKREALLAIAIAPALFYWTLTRLSGDRGVVRVRDDQVAVIVDHLSGSTRVSAAPGHQVFLPWFQEVYLLDKQPIAYRFEGNSQGAANVYPRLFVRANDGSTFWFDQFTLQYSLLPDRAALVVADSGVASVDRERLVNAYARSILRDEFGRFAAEDIVKPEVLRTATSEARRRMNELLLPHGIAVLEVALAKPRFDPLYEKAIERRKVGNQEVEHLRAAIEKLKQEHNQRIAKLRTEKEQELAVKKGNLARDLLAAEQEAIRVKSQADIYSLQRTSDAHSARSHREQEAAGRVDAYTQEAAGLAERAQALDAQGEAAVRAALIEKLASIEFTVVPYSRDPAPKRIETGEGDKP